MLFERLARIFPGSLLQAGFKCLDFFSTHLRMLLIRWMVGIGSIGVCIFQYLSIFLAQVFVVLSVLALVLTLMLAVVGVFLVGGVVSLLICRSMNRTGCCTGGILTN